MVRVITFTPVESVLPDDIDDRVKKIQERLEELDPEFNALKIELEKIAGRLIGLHKDLWDKEYEYLMELVDSILPDMWSIARDLKKLRAGGKPW